MRRFIQGTWLPTAIFVALCTVYVARELSECGPISTVGIPVTGLVVVPVTWWWLVARAGRPRLAHGAAAGALCVILTMNLAPILATLWSQRRHLHEFALGIEVGFMLLLYISVGGPIGAIVGALVAMLQCRSWPAAVRRPAATKGAPQRAADGALAGAFIAALAGLTVAVAMAFSTMSHDSFEVLLAIGALWLLMIPLGAALGAVVAVLRARNHGR